MNIEPGAQRTGSKTHRATNAIAVCVLGTLAGIQLWGGIAFFLNPGGYGDFGWTIDTAWRVAQVTPGFPANRAGVKVGDLIDPRPDTYTVNGPGNLTIGQRATFADEHAGTRRTLTLTAVRAAPLSAVEMASQIIVWLNLCILLLVAGFLALIRPDKITWGFYLGAAVLVWSFTPGAAPPLPVAVLLPVDVLCFAVLAPAGVVGFLEFSLRFPSNHLTAWRRIVDRLTPLIFVILAVFQPYYWGMLYVVTSPRVLHTLQHMWDFNCAAAVLVSLVSVIGMYRGSSGLDRQRVRWVVLGYACVCVSVFLAILDNENMFSSFAASDVQQFSIWSWLLTAGQSLIIVFPLAVAYAVIRHRVIDVRFVVSRALVYGTIAIAVSLIIILLDWLFSRIPTTRFQVAVVAAVALLVGFSLNAARQRLGRTVDALFFGKWFRTQRQAEAIDAALHRASSKTELYDLLTSRVAEAFSLASAALFERAGDGGFVRVAARGWPAGTVWHVLPTDPLARLAEANLKVGSVDSLPWREPEIPAGAARPAISVPIVADKVVVATLLLGAHEDGTALDPDELRVIRRLCADAGPVYGFQPISESSRPAFLSEPIGV